MNVTRSIVIGLAVVLILGGLTIAGSPEMVLARCYPQKVLVASSQYYARHWGIAMATMGMLIGGLGWQPSRSALRWALGGLAGAYLGMITNFWHAFKVGWIPYVDACVQEEIGLEIGLGAVILFGVVWEALVRDWWERRRV